MFSNLLGNAITHGAGDMPVHVGARCINGTFTLWIENQGASIPEETRKKLFQPFFRGDVRASQQGLGLGLFIAHEIARAHNGTLEAHSDEQVTRFTFTMPISG